MAEDDRKLMFKLVAYQSKFMDGIINKLIEINKFSYLIVINLHETLLNCIFTHSILKNFMYLDFLP